MKKLLIFTIFAIISLFSVTAHASDSIKFTTVQTYNGITYTCFDTYYAGKTNTEIVKSLPRSLIKDVCIHSFAIYYDKIYYFTAPQGSDGIQGSIYRSNLDGTNNELIANNVGGFYIQIFLSDGCLYYKDFYISPNSYKRYSNGIIKINLNTGETKRIITDYDAYLVNILDDKLFYKASSGYHLMNTNGAYIGGISANDVEVASDIIVGTTTYNGYDGAIYASCWGLNSKWICNVPRYVNGYPTNYEYPRVVNVTGGYIYYSISFYPKYYYGATPNKAMLRVPVTGGASELVAQWYVS